MPTINWGILSTANIGRKAVAPAIKAAGNGQLLAVASRDLAAAEAYALELGVERAYGSYQELLEDAEVNAVYLPLPNSLHKPWTIRAVEAGKHALCEKLLALSAAECRVMADAAEQNGMKLMEAFMYRFHPRTRAAVDLVRSGHLGDLKLVRAVFTFALRNPDNIRLDPKLGGGALMDVGCYCVTIARLLFGGEALEAQAFARYGDTGVDEELVATLRFPGDAYAQLHCALTLDRQEFYHAVGSGGRLEVERAFLPGTTPTEWRLITPDAPPQRRTFEGTDQYRLMVEHFADCILSDQSPHNSPDDAASTMATIEALYRSARHGGRPERIAIPSSDIGVERN